MRTTVFALAISLALTCVASGQDDDEEPGMVVGYPTRPVPPPSPYEAYRLVARRAIARRQRAIEACFQDELARGPAFEGDIAIRATIDRRGRFTAVSSESDTTGHPTVAECVMAILRTLTATPSPRRAFTYTFPFRFRSGDAPSH